MTNPDVILCWAFLPRNDLHLPLTTSFLSKEHIGLCLVLPGLTFKLFGEASDSGHRNGSTVLVIEEGMPVRDEDLESQIAREAEQECECLVSPARHAWKGPEGHRRRKSTAEWRQRACLQCGHLQCRGCCCQQARWDTL